MKFGKVVFTQVSVCAQRGLSILGNRPFLEGRVSEVNLLSCYQPQGKVMFSEASVSHSVHSGYPF